MAEHGTFVARVRLVDHPEHDKFLVVQLLEPATDEQREMLEIAVRVPVCLVLTNVKEPAEAGPPRYDHPDF